MHTGQKSLRLHCTHHTHHSTIAKKSEPFNQSEICEQQPTLMINWWGRGGKKAHYTKLFSNCKGEISYKAPIQIGSQLCFSTVPPTHQTTTLLQSINKKIRKKRGDKKKPNKGLRRQWKMGYQNVCWKLVHMLLQAPQPPLSCEILHIWQAWSQKKIITANITFNLSNHHNRRIITPQFMGRVEALPKTKTGWEAFHCQKLSFHRQLNHRK